MLKITASGGGEIRGAKPLALGHTASPARPHAQADGDSASSPAPCPRPTEATAVQDPRSRLGSSGQMDR